MTAAGLNPAADVTLVQQQFDMEALLSGEIDAAQAMSYNEYAQVLEATNPDTGALYQPSDFSVINWEDQGTAMLQDAIWADTERLESDGPQADVTHLVGGGEKRARPEPSGQERGRRQRQRQPSPRDEVVLARLDLSAETPRERVAHHDVEEQRARDGRREIVGNHAG